MDDPEGAGDETSQDGKSKNKGKAQVPVTKRQLGRLKNKMALTRAVEGGSGRPGEVPFCTEEKEDRQRENKRPKSEVGDIAECGDVAMDES